MPTEEGAYVDEKGRTRWRRNDEIAEKLTDLYDFLVIGGYEESHARRYNQLAYAISRHPELIDALHAADSLGEIPGIGCTVATIIGEYVERGTCGKFEEFAEGTKTMTNVSAVDVFRRGTRERWADMVDE